MLQSIQTIDGDFEGLFESDKNNGGSDQGNLIRREFYAKWGFYATVDEIVMGQTWLEDEIFSWPVRRFLNRLVFMKDKNKVADLINKLNAPKRK